MVQLGDLEHPANILEILGASGKDLQRDQMLRRNHGDVMLTGSDDASLIQKPLLQPGPGEHEVEAPARWLVGDR